MLVDIARNVYYSTGCDKVRSYGLHTAAQVEAYGDITRFAHW